MTSPRQLQGLSVDPEAWERMNEKWQAELERRKATQALPLDAEAFLERVSWHGREDGPGLLFDTVQAGQLAAGALAGVLVSVWTGAEFPERELPRRMWVRWFREADYPKPTTPMTLYRGAVSRYARGMAWTTSQTRAHWFANRWGADLELDPFIVNFGTPEQQQHERERRARAVERAKVGGEQLAHVYAAIVEPAGILAVVEGLEADGRKEEEVIVDPAYLPRPVRRDPDR